MKINQSPVCDTCGKESRLEWKGSFGSTGAYLNTVGFIYKNAVLYTGENTPLSFCSSECQVKYYSEVLKIPEAKLKQVKGIMDDVRESIKKDIPKITEHLNQVSKVIKEIKERGINGKKQK